MGIAYHTISYALNSLRPSRSKFRMNAKVTELEVTELEVTEVEVRELEVRELEWARAARQKGPRSIAHQGNSCVRLQQCRVG